MPILTIAAAVSALGDRGLVLVRHPEGEVLAPGGGKTTWPAVAAPFVVSRRVTRGEIEIAEWVRSWNESNGCFAPKSWEPSLATVMDARSGRVVATFDLQPEAALLQGLLTILSDPRHG